MDLEIAGEILALARQAEAQAAVADGQAWVARLEARAGEIEPAAQEFLDRGQPGGALALVGALAIFWQDVGRVEEGRRLTEWVLERTEDGGGDRERASAWLVLGQLAFRQGDQRTATEATSAALKLAHACGDDVLAGRAELNLARVAFRDGKASRIAEHAERAAACAGDNLRLRAGAIHMLGWAAYTAGDVDGAIARFAQNAETYRAAGHLLDYASELANIGDLVAEQGDLDGGARYVRDALDVPGVDSSSYLAPALVRSAGVLAVQRGNEGAGLALLAAAERFYDEFGLIGDPGDELSPEAMGAADTVLGRADALRARERSSGWSLGEAVRAASDALR